MEKLPRRKHAQKYHTGIDRWIDGRLMMRGIDRYPGRDRWIDDRFIERGIDRYPGIDR